MFESPIFALFVFFLFPLCAFFLALRKKIFKSALNVVLFFLFFALASWAIVSAAVFVQEKYWGMRAADAVFFRSWGWLFILFPMLMLSLFFAVAIAAEKRGGKDKIIAGVYFKSDILFGGMVGSSPLGYVEFKEDCFVCGIRLVGTREIAYSDADVRLGKTFIWDNFLISDKRSGRQISVFTISDFAREKLLENFGRRSVGVSGA